MGYFWVGIGFDNCFGVLVEQLSFSLFLSILTFDFELILGSFLTFLGPNGLFLGLRKGLQNCFGVYSCS